MRDVLRPSARLIAAFGLVSFVFLAFVDSASAQPEQRLLVGPFRGPQAGKLRASLIANLTDQQGVAVIDNAQVDRMRGELGISGWPTGADRSRLAQRLRATAILEGVMRRHRRSWALTVIVRSPATGEVMGSETWSGRTVASVGGVRRNGYERLAPHIRASYSRSGASAAQAASTQQSAAGQQGQSGQTAAASGAQGQQAQQQQQQQQQQQSGTQSQGAASEDASQEATTPPQAEDDEGEFLVSVPPEEEEGPSGEPYDSLRVSLLGGLVHRDMSTNVIAFNQEVMPPDPGRTVQEKREYVSGGTGHSEFGLELEVYPWSFERRQAAPWIGAIARYRRSVGLSSHGPPCERDGCPTGSTVEVATTQWELYAGARGRLRLGERRRSPHIFLDVGYGVFAFDLAAEDLQNLERKSIVAPFEYSYLHGGVGFTYGIIPTYLEIGLNAAYRLGIDIGTDAKAVWGRTTDTMSGLIGGVSLRTEMPYLADGVFFSMSAEYFRFSTTFSGQTVCIDACPPGGPWEEWPANPVGTDNLTGGIPKPVIDEYFRLSVAFGYALK